MHRIHRPSSIAAQSKLRSYRPSTNPSGENRRAPKLVGTIPVQPARFTYTCTHSHTHTPRDTDSAAEYKLALSSELACWWKSLVHAREPTHGETHESPTRCRIPQPSTNWRRPWPGDERASSKRATWCFICVTMQLTVTVCLRIKITGEMRPWACVRATAPTTIAASHLSSVLPFKRVVLEEVARLRHHA